MIQMCRGPQQTFMAFIVISFTPLKLECFGNMVTSRTPGSAMPVVAAYPILHSPVSPSNALAHFAISALNPFQQLIADIFLLPRFAFERSAQELQWTSTIPVPRIVSLVVGRSQVPMCSFILPGSTPQKGVPIGSRGATNNRCNLRPTTLETNGCLTSTML